MRIKSAVVALSIGGLLFHFLIGIAHAEAPGHNESFTLAINPFAGSQISLGDSLPILGALGYLGDTLCYIIGDYDIHISDSVGVRIQRANGIVLTPPPPPGNYYIRNGDSMVFVVPVELVQPNSGRVRILANILKDYSLGRGSYSVQALGLITYFPPSVIFERDNLQERYWAEPQLATERFRLESNIIEITIE